MKRLSLVLCVLGASFLLTACGSSGSAQAPVNAQACTYNNGTVYPYGAGVPNATCAGLPAGYTYANGQVVYTGAPGIGTTPYSPYGYGTTMGYGAGYGAGIGAGYGANPCAVYGSTWFPSNGMCISYYGY